MQALPRQTAPRHDKTEPEAGPMDANHAAIALATAMNEARAALAVREEQAESARGAGLQRMQALRSKLAPLYAAIPRDVEMFDLGFVTPEKPRLFIDIIAYVEPGRDGAGYRFVQESRSGRKTLLETEDEAALIREITRYMAQRLVARERALTQSEDDRPRPLIRQPAPIIPLTAEEAFRQWTRGSVTRVDQPETPPAAMQENNPAPARPSGETDQVASPSPAEPVSDKVEPSEQTRQPSTIGSTPEATANPSRQGQGWWLWPTTALLIGASLGVLAIYLYAARLT